MGSEETPYRIEPCHLTSIPGGLADVIGELIAASNRLGSRLHPTTAASMGELVAVPRGEAGRILGRSDRAARDQLKRLTQSGLLVSETPKGPVSLHFTIDAAESLFPKLYLAQAM